MGGQVEAIVLSPAPAEEEAAQDGGLQERPDQELWRQGNHGERTSKKRQDSEVSSKDDGEGEEKENEGGGGGEDSKDAEDKARLDEGDSNARGQAGPDRGKVTEGTAKGECAAVYVKGGRWWAGAGHEEGRDLIGGRGDLGRESWLGDPGPLSPASGRQAVIPSRDIISVIISLGKVILPYCRWENQTFPEYEAHNNLKGNLQNINETSELM